MKRMSGQAGVDEAGCGSLIGSLVAAAVIVPDGVAIEGLDDSKKIKNPKRRETLHDAIRSKCYVGIGRVTLEEINSNPFSWVRRTVFVRALDNLADASPVAISSIIVDGNGFFDGFRDIPYALEPKADGKYESVAAASIIAKVTRDAEITSLANEYPVMSTRFGWASNMGYPTSAHLNALSVHGPTEHHRITFRPCRSK